MVRRLHSKEPSVESIKSWGSGGRKLVEPSSTAAVLNGSGEKSHMKQGGTCIF